MLINESELAARINSPHNLMNKLSSLRSSGTRKNAMSLFIKPSIDKPKLEEPPTPKEEPKINKTITSREEETSPRIEELVSDSNEQVRLGLAHDAALEILSLSMQQLKDKLPEIHPSKLPSVIAATSKVVEGIRKERLEQAKQGKDREVHYHFYTPQQKKIADYDIIEATAVSASGA